MFDPLKRFSLDPRTKKILYFIAGCIGIFLFLLLLIYIKDGQSETVFLSQESQKDYSLASLSFNIFVKLLIIIGIIYLIFYIYRWWQTKNAIIRKNRLSIKESIRFTPKQAVHIIRVDDKEFLIGATDQQISLLSVIDTYEKSEGVLASEDDQIEVGGFKNVLEESINDPFDLVKGDKKNDK